MNKKMSRYKGLILSCVSVLMIVFCVCSFSFESKAVQVQDTGKEFYVRYARPSMSENQGYVNLLFYNSDRGYYVNTVFWNIYCYTPDGDSLPVQAYITISDSGWEIHPYVQLNNYNGSIYSVYYYNGEGNLTHAKSSTNEAYIHKASGIRGFQAFGNVQIVNNLSRPNSIPFTVYYSEDGSATLLRDVINLLQWDKHTDSVVSDTVYSILNSVDGLENQLMSVINYLKSVDDKLPSIKDKLEDIYDKLDEMLEEEKKQTNWLEKIWNSIQEFITPDEESKEESDKLQNESNDKTDKLDDLNEQNKTDKTDIDGASNSVDENVDLESIDNYGKVLAVITENQYILQILLLVFSVALVAYVLFGKK